MPGLRALEVRVRLARLLAVVLLGIAELALAQDGCPASLAHDLTSEAPACWLTDEGVLHSGRGINDVSYQLYRWVSTREAEPSRHYDIPPYNNTAVILTLTARPDDPPFWTGFYDLGMAWFEAPYIVQNAEYGEFLIVPGRYSGTGSFIDEKVFRAGHEVGWTRVGSTGLDPDTGEGWVEGLNRYLPPGHGIWKGVVVDYATLSGTTAVWRDGDANCCPSGGEIRFRLGIGGSTPALEVVGAEYLPPAQ